MPTLLPSLIYYHHAHCAFQLLAFTYGTSVSSLYCMKIHTNNDEPADTKTKSLMFGLCRMCAELTVTYSGARVIQPCLYLIFNIILILFNLLLYRHA